MRQASVHTLWCLIFAGVATGCQSASRLVDIPPPPPSAPTLSIHILPALSTLPFASTVQFQALTMEGTPASVRWRMDDPVVGSISQDGVLTPSVCANGRPVVIQAILIADTTQVAELHTFGAFEGPEAIFFESLTNLPGGEQTNADSVTGSIVIHVFLGQSLRCEPLRLILLERIIGTTATPLDSIRFDPTVMPPDRAVFTLDTKTSPNGAYGLRGTAFVVGNPSGIVTNTVLLRVLNP